MGEDRNGSSISGARSIDEMGEFWDAHDVTDFDDQTREVEFAFDLQRRRHYIAIDPDLLARLCQLAAERGLSAGSLANLWLQERVLHSTSAFDDALRRVKTMVRVAANTSAWLVEQEGDLLLKFDSSGAYPGVELCLSRAWRTRPLLLPQKKVQKFDFRDAFASGCT